MPVSKFDPIPVRPGPRPTPVAVASRREFRPRDAAQAADARPFGPRTTSALFSFETNGRIVSRDDIRVGIHTVEIRDEDYAGDNDNVERVTFYRNIAPARGDAFTLTVYATVAMSVRIVIWIRNRDWRPGDPPEDKYFVGYSAGRLR